MKKWLVISIFLFSLAGCSQTAPAEPETAEIEESLAEQWLADDAETTQPVTIADAEAAAGETPLTAFDYTIRDDHTAAILKFTGTETEVTIPAMVGDAPVTEIGQYAFEAAWNVQKITIPDSVTVIGEQAFLDCSALTEIRIPDGVTALPRAVFAGCSSLTEMTIPAGVTSTDEELFSGCMLTDLYILNPALPYASWGLEDLDPKCTIHAPEGAEILTWAQENGFPTEIQ